MEGFSKKYNGFLVSREKGSPQVNPLDKVTKSMTENVSVCYIASRTTFSYAK